MVVLVCVLKPKKVIWHQLTKAWLIIALYALKDVSIQPSEKIIKALTASEYYSLGVCKPFILITKSF